jgi:uncharacterized protein YbjT (DUF2867 family)
MNLRKRILVTGATGNIGIEVIRFLYKNNTHHRIFAGVRDIENAKKTLAGFDKLQFVQFDFENTDTFDDALRNIDSVFILRPPHISDTETYFRPLIKTIKEKNISETMFLSVQGAEKSRIIPHNKIEKLIIEHHLDYIFLRPSYFMQNLTTTLLLDIKLKRKIILPAGKAKFNWIDAENIGEIGAILLDKFQAYKNQAIELTGSENEDFYTVETIMNQALSKPVKYVSLNPLSFYGFKKREGMNKGMILVMIMLHFLPRFQKPPRISSFYESITGKKPTCLKGFIEREKPMFE